MSTEIMMRILGRLAQVDDQKFFLGRVIVATARGYPVEAIRSTSGTRLPCWVWRNRDLWRLQESREHQRLSRWSSWRTTNEP